MLPATDAWFEDTQEGVVIIDREGFVAYANPAAERLIGCARRDIVGRHALAFLSPAPRPRLHAASATGELSTNSYSLQQFPLHGANGRIIARMVILRPRNTTKSRARNVMESRDLAARLMQRLMLIDLHHQEFPDLLQAVLQVVCGETGWPVGHAFVPSADDPAVLVSAGVWCLRDARFKGFEAITRDLHLRAGEGLPGRAMELQRPVWMTDVDLDAAFVRAALTSELGVHAGFAFPVYARGRLVAVLEFFDRQAIQPDPAFLATIESLSRQVGMLFDNQRQRQDLDQLVYTDALTGTGNRRRFNEAMETAYDLSRQGMTCAVCLFDMDRFKSINDRFGHAEGDRVLAEAARLARFRLRARDVLARIGGEEFAVVMFDIALPHAGQVAEALRTAIESGIALPDASQAVTASFGVAELDTGRDADGLATLKRADMALYAAKHDGRNRVVISK